MNPDLIVVGLGAVGSAALHHATASGLSAVGIEQFPIGHDRGSSHGESRIIRKAYFLHPDYVPLLDRAYELWRELEGFAGRPLLETTGLLCAGSADGSFINGLERCYAAHDLPHERLSADEAMRRHPQFHLPSDAVVYFDPLGGFLRADDCVRAHLDSARARGATIYDDEAVCGWSSDANGVTVTTTRRTLHAGHLLLATGAWVVPEFAEIGISLRAKRKVLFWHRLVNPARFRPNCFPAYIAKFDGVATYGFPTLDGATMKSAEDSGGQWIDDPASVDRENLEPGDEAALRRFLDVTFQGAVGPRAAWKTCLYTVAPDNNFVLGPHPGRPHVTLASCCSGHGFKLSSVMGELLARTVRDGAVPPEARFLTLEKQIKQGLE